MTISQCLFKWQPYRFGFDIFLEESGQVTRDIVGLDGAVPLIVMRS